MRLLIIIFSLSIAAWAGTNNGGLKEVATDDTLDGKGTFSEPLTVIGGNISIPDGANCIPGEAAGGSGSANEAQDCTDYVTQVEGDARAVDVDLSTFTLSASTVTNANEIANLSISTQTNADNLVVHEASCTAHHFPAYNFSWGVDVGKGFKFKSDVFETGPLFFYEGSTL